MVTFDLVERSPEEQRAWMSEHSGVYALLVAEIEGDVVGFASLSPYRTRPGYSTTAEDSIYVARVTSRRRRRQGAALGSRRPGPAARISFADRPHRRRSCGVDRGAPRVRFRSDRYRARDRQEVRPLARRLPDASAALTTRRRSRKTPSRSAPTQLPDPVVARLGVVGVQPVLASSLRGSAWRNFGYRYATAINASTSAAPAIRAGFAIDSSCSRTRPPGSPRKHADRRESDQQATRLSFDDERQEDESPRGVPRLYHRAEDHEGDQAPAHRAKRPDPV